MLAGRQSERSGEVAPRPEGPRIGIERDHRRGDQRPEGRDFVEMADHRARGSGDLRLQSVDPSVEPLDFGGQHRRRLAGGLGKAFVPLRKRKQVLDPVDAPSGDEAELREMAAQRVHGHRSLLDHERAGLVQHQHGLLVGALDRDEPHIGPRHRLSDRRRIVGVVLAALEVGLDVSRRHQNHLVSQRPELTRPMVRRSASFHPDPGRTDPSKETQELRPAQFPPHRRRSFTFDRMDLKEPLAQVDPNSDKLFHGRLLLFGVANRPPLAL